MSRRNSEGFLQKYDNPYIKEIMFYYTGKYKIAFQNGTEKEHTFDFDATYLSQFDVPISSDGRLLFISNWYNGLSAIDTKTGEQIWHYKATRIYTVFAFPTFILAEKMNKALIKFDIRTGEVMNEIKSGTIESLYYLADNEVLVDSIRGKLSVVDPATLCIIKSYSHKDTNPSDCLSQVIIDAKKVNGEIVLYGFEEYANRDYQDKIKVNFQRILPAPQ